MPPGVQRRSGAAVRLHLSGYAIVVSSRILRTRRRREIIPTRKKQSVQTAANAKPMDTTAASRTPESLFGSNQYCASVRKTMRPENATKPSKPPQKPHRHAATAAITHPSSKAAMSTATRITLWLTDPAPVTLGLEPRRNRGIRCSQFVRLWLHNASTAPPLPMMKPGRRI